MKLTALVIGLTMLFGRQEAFSSKQSPAAIVQEPVKDLTAENMLLWQRSNGGWPKSTYNVLFDDTKESPKHPTPAKILIDYTQPPTPEQKKLALDSRYFQDATIDNEHTVQEIRYLLKAYRQTKNEAYLKGAQKGIDYLLVAQYPNGGWPQFYPDTRFYRHDITFNDNAMINVLNLLYDVYQKNGDASLVAPAYIPLAATAVKKGVDIILKTQLQVQGKSAVWCAQYDEKTLAPSQARKYELPSLSGAESVGIVRFLMRIDNPTPEIKDAVNHAIAWFNNSAIQGYKTVRVTDTTQPTGQDVLLVEAPASVIWARFYDLQTNQPFFCDRDGIKKETLAEIGNERRTGYSWYGNWAAKLIGVDYPKWKEGKAATHAFNP